MAKRGRPPLSRRTIVMHLRIPDALYDALSVQAIRRDRPVYVLARQVLANFCVQKSDATPSSPHTQP